MPWRKVVSHKIRHHPVLCLTHTITVQHEGTTQEIQHKRVKSGGLWLGLGQGDRKEG